MIGEGNGNGILVSSSDNTTIGTGADGITDRNVIADDGADDGAGIYVVDLNGVTINGNYLGTNALGNGDFSFTQNNTSDIEASHASSLTISNNVISGGAYYGILLFPDVTNSFLEGNRIGTNAAGTAAIGDTYGIYMTIGISNIQIGGVSPGQGNLISGNDYGVIAASDDCTQITIEGNDIGTDLTGLTAIGNTIGVQVAGGADVIGGTIPGAGNLISGNIQAGVRISNLATDAPNYVLGNLIGTDVTGENALANGVGVELSGFNTTVGGPSPADLNVISGNTGPGISIGNQGSVATGDTVQGNYIGTDLSGLEAVPDQLGVEIGNTSGEAVIGNVISGNGPAGGLASGVLLDSASNVTVTDNLIGTDKTGNVALANQGPGIYLLQGDADNVIGLPGQGNVISGNTGGGILMVNPDTSNNSVEGNFIGTNALGTTITGTDNNPLGNAGFGIQIYEAQGNFIGEPNEGNVISGNLGDGIDIEVPTATNNSVQGNSIGTDSSGSLKLGNTGSGVYVTFVNDETIGGLGAGQGNTIAYNGGDGVLLGTSSSVSIRGNSIHDNGGLGINLGMRGGNDQESGPVLTGAITGTSTTINGTLSAEPNSTYSVDFYANPSVSGEGQDYLGSTTVTTDGAGSATFTATPGTTVPVGWAVCATATDSAGDTSEFSSDVVNNRPTSVYVASTYTGDAAGAVVTWTDGSTHTIGSDAFGTIQSGINAVAPGGVVNVASGTYSGQLTINQSLSLLGSGALATTIQDSASASGDEIAIASGITVTIAGVNVDGASTSTAIDVSGGNLSSNNIGITGYNVGVSVENGGAATITGSTITGSSTGVRVGAGSLDTASVTATGDSFAGDTVGIQDNESAGQVTASMDWWGNATGPTSPSNPGGTGATLVGSVNVSSWLGDANVVAPNSLVVPSSAGNSFVVAPNATNTGLGVSLGAASVGSITAGGTISFAGSGANVTIVGESLGTNVFTIQDTSVTFGAADPLYGTTISFSGTGMTRFVDAAGSTNTFNIQGTGASGPSGSLVGDAGTDAFVFSGSSKFAGSIQGAGASTLNYSAYGSAVNVNLANGTSGTATGVSGTVGGITAVIGGNSNDILNAGTTPNVVLTGGLGTNTLSGTGSGDSVVESIASGYTLTATKLTGTGPAFTDNLSGITVASLTGVSTTSNTFTVSSWTGTGSLSAPTGTGIVTASKSAGYALTNTLLSSTDGMALGLSGITTANLTDTGNTHTFSVTGWTGSGTLKGTTETMVDAISNSSVLTNTSLVVTGLPTLTLSGFKTASLTDSVGGNTFTVSGWTGSGSLVDVGTATDTVSASKSASFTLTNSSLSSTDGMALTMSGIATAILNASSASRTFTVGGWTGSGSLTDTATGIVAASKNAGFNLNSALLSTGDGMTLALSGITTANLTDTGNTHMFSVAGWAGSGTLTGTAETLADVVSSNAVLTNTSLAVSGLPTLTLSGFSGASLTDTAGGITFTVSGWTGTGSLTDSAASGDTVVASKNAGFTLSSASLSSTDGMTLGLSGVTTGNLTDTGNTHTFTVTGWTGSGTLKGTTETLADVIANSAVLANTSLAVLGSPTLTLSGFNTANVTDTAGGNTFTVSGWTGSGSLVDVGTATDTVSASKSASFTLTNSSLSSTDGMALTMSGIATANLGATSASKTFTVSGWTGSGSLTDTATGIVAASKNAGFTLTNTSLSTGDGMALALSGITTANLTDTGNTHMFSVAGWAGSGTLTGTAETLADVVSSNAVLTNTSLAVSGLPTLTLSGFSGASLTDTAGGITFTVSGWTGTGSLTDSAASGDTVVASKNVGFTLNSVSLSSTDGMALGLSGVTTANLTDTGNAHTFSVTGWTGSGTLKGTTETVADVISSSAVLTNASLVVTGLPTLTLSGFKTASLTDSVGGNTFTVSGWTGSGSLVDVGTATDTVSASKSASFTLTNSSLSSTDGMALTMSGIATANLGATSTSKTFTVSGWTGSGSLTDTATGIVAASKNAGFTLTNTSLSTGDGMALALSGITTANLTTTASSGSPSFTVVASAYTGVTNLTAAGSVNATLFGGPANGSTLSASGSGNDVLIGGAGKATLTDTGTGHNILIGGPAADTITGNGNDILISGTTNYGSDTTANIAALDAILAEWSSNDSYSTRISKIMSGVGPGGADALNTSTCQLDSVVNTVSDGSSSTQNNWFIVNSKDKVTKQTTETETIA